MQASERRELRRMCRVSAADMRPSCLTDEALIEMRRERELEEIVLIGLPSADDQLEIAFALDGEKPLSRELTLPESLVWCAHHGVGLVDAADALVA